MRFIISFVCLISLSILGSICLAQSGQNNFYENGGAYPMAHSDAHIPCITPEQYVLLEASCKANIAKLGLNQPSESKVTKTSLNWPLRAASGFKDCGYYSISAYVDQDTTAGIKDYNCGTNTYNGHFGTDIFSYPFSFLKMDKNQVEVIAAAPGTIINKADGNFDKNCAGNSLQANFVAVQHTDGSIAFYFHMKSGSVTTKAIGQTVLAGEYLGIVGSSGNSTGPHLHFEVWSGSSVATRIDPYAGSCNLLNGSTWWTAQAAYRNPSVIKAGVHKAPPIYPPCPATEISNEDTCFMPGANAVFAIFLRDETSGMTAKMQILDASSKPVSSWQTNSTNNHNGSYWYWTRTLPSTKGRYTFEVSYNGTTCSKSFWIDCSLAPTGIEGMAEAQQIAVSPNPVHSFFTVSGSQLSGNTCQVTLTNVLGQTVLTDQPKLLNRSLFKTYPVTDLPAGMYYLSIEAGTFKNIRRLFIAH
ncbi:MAG: peptidoglycan DD-metalloendopeptidase family protein [Bacteroidetes bacterium]|nr:peptidoglycan DD-metalloendopeptidase family protein [Bacteroidota bacterium]MBS1748244.1 peptidoglycan DD-metalloendopeptidase family protein [Bacteroidota bacterium]